MCGNIMDEKRCCDAKEYFSIIRGMINHEDQLVNQRLTWMWTLQALLFAAVSFNREENPFFSIVISILGIVSSASIGYQMRRGDIAIMALRKLSAEHKEKLPKGCRLAPVIGVEEVNRSKKWLLPNYLLPWVFAVAWILIMIQSIFFFR